jgi:hypothetical protein
MEASPVAQEPHLEAPGAGLPKLELWIARWLFHRRRKRATREEAAALFQAEHDKIQDLVRDLPPEAASRRVLIPRPRGLEDSSRYWSVFMVLDHLRIVNHGITEAIRLLASGQTPGRPASTAAVKPSPKAGPEASAAFERSCENLERCVSAISDLRTAKKYPHPWFGPLDVAGWHLLAGVHMGLHRRQIETILAAPPA